MRQSTHGVRALLFIVALILPFAVSTGAANAASVYDGIVKTTTSVKLQTSTAYCSSSTATEHNSDWGSVVSTALSTYNTEHSNAIADWESDWSNKVGWAVFPFTGANNQKFFFVYYSASYGENVFFNSGGTDYFTIYDPAPVTPFRSLIIMTKGDYYGNCNDQPVIGSASTGGLSVTADNFNTDYKLFLSTFTTFYPGGYEGVAIPSEYVPPVPVLYPYSGTVDCGENILPESLYIYQDGNNGMATLGYESPGRATWDYSLANSPYSVTVDCGSYSLSSEISVDPWDMSTDPVIISNNNWLCVRHIVGPSYCTST